jgi:hypothetical protein
MVYVRDYEFAAVPNTPGQGIGNELLSSAAEEATEFYKLRLHIVACLVAKPINCYIVQVVVEVAESPMHA